MKFRRTLRYHSLRRPRVRQTWNKYNLFNLTKGWLANIPLSRTLFQQKWAAKRVTRGYHGEHIKERRWEQMFSRRLLSVVNMQPGYLAKYDGSEQATGRGSGRDGRATGDSREDLLLGMQRGGKKYTPYMQMTFAPMERRLDIAIFRALFASSARQARQFCVHGAVKVNGKKMKFPGYLLNPGDMFQVDVERVLFATGAKKDPNALMPPSETAEREEAEADLEASEASASETPEGETEAKPASEEEVAEDEEAAAAAAVKDDRAKLLALRDQLKSFLAKAASDLSGKQKVAFRALAKDIKTAISRTGKSGTKQDDVEALTSLFTQLEIAAAPEEKSQGQEQDEDGLTGEERQRLTELLVKEAENPWDPDKPYATPWRPRPFMGPFAFIPRYLEVNQKICSAVYVRHPVARSGQAEVPTPWPEKVTQLAFNWYLRRR